MIGLGAKNIPETVILGCDVHLTGSRHEDCVLAHYVEGRSREITPELYSAGVGHTEGKGKVNRSAKGQGDHVSRTGEVGGGEVTAVRPRAVSMGEAGAPVPPLPARTRGSGGTPGSLRCWRRCSAPQPCAAAAGPADLATHRESVRELSTTISRLRLARGVTGQCTKHNS